MGLTDWRQTAKNITDYPQNEKNIYWLPAINRQPAWSDIVGMFLNRNKSYFFIPRFYQGYCVQVDHVKSQFLTYRISCHQLTCVKVRAAVTSRQNIVLFVCLLVFFFFLLVLFCSCLPPIGSICKIQLKFHNGTDFYQKLNGACLNRGTQLALLHVF